MAQAPKSGGQNPKGKTRRELARESVAENRQARRGRCHPRRSRSRHHPHRLGSEVAARGRANIAEAYAREEDGQLVLINSTIPTYAPPVSSITSPAASASFW